MSDRTQIAQALMGSLGQGTTSQFAVDPTLEAQAAQTGYQAPIHPLVRAIMNRLGVMGMVRNQANQTMAGVGNANTENPFQ